MASLRCLTALLLASCTGVNSLLVHLQGGTSTRSISLHSSGALAAKQWRPLPLRSLTSNDRSSPTHLMAASATKLDTSLNLGGNIAEAAAGKAVGAEYRLLDVEGASASWKLLPDMWDFLEEECGGSTALIDPIHGDLRGSDALTGRRDGNSSQQGQKESSSVEKLEVPSMTYSELRSSIVKMAGALQALGVGQQECVSIFSENSLRWFVAEQGVMKAGSYNAVRGATAPVEELAYIHRDSGAVGAVFEKVLLLKELLAMENGPWSGKEASPRFVVILFPDGRSGMDIQKELNVPLATRVVTYQECLSLVAPFVEPVKDPSMRATLVYTSGTTSKPKGVVLRHSNLIHQVAKNSFNRVEGHPLDPWVGDMFVSVLPCWHIFERTAEYYVLSHGVTMVYSNVRNFKKDLRKYRPHFLIAVPRLLETIYTGVQNQMASKSVVARKVAGLFMAASKVRMRASRVRDGMVRRTKKPRRAERIIAAVLMAAVSPLSALSDVLVWSKIREGVGGRVKVVVSGGSGLANGLEDFFDMSGLRVIVGYGLTETSPVIANRLAEHNLRGSVGRPVPGTVIKVSDLETGETLQDGETGRIMVKGDQVMSEYHNNPTATSAAINKEGFFDTGDIGYVNLATGDLIVTGRAKDTIVLSNGENVEPQPLEDAISGGCKLIDQVMIVGQDQRSLGAVVTLNVLELAKSGIISKEDGERYSALLGPMPLTAGPTGSPKELEAANKELLSTPGLKEAVGNGVRQCCHGFRPWEQISGIVMTFEPFTTSNGLITQTLKTKRDAVATRFSKEISRLYE